MATDRMANVRELLAEAGEQFARRNMDAAKTLEQRAIVQLQLELLEADDGE